MNFLQRKFSIGILLFAMASLTNAYPPDGPDKEKPKEDDANYYPMQVGNKWTYRLSVGEKSGRLQNAITKIETIDGVDLARLEATMDGKILANEHLRQTKNGVFRYRNAGQVIAPAIPLLKYPARSGMKWKGAFAAGAEKGKYSCEAKEDTVEVPAGKYKAMRVTIDLEVETGGIVQTSYWFVNDVGFVKQIVGDGAGTRITMELERFEKGKK